MFLRQVFPEWGWTWFSSNLRLSELLLAAASAVRGRLAWQSSAGPHQQLNQTYSADRRLEASEQQQVPLAVAATARVTVLWSLN